MAASLVILLAAGEPALGAKDCTASGNPPPFPCCAVNPTLQAGAYYCSGTDQAGATNLTFSGTLVSNPGSPDDITCSTTFTYTYAGSCSPANRTLRFCWRICDGANAADACSAGCSLFCEDIGVGASPVAVAESNTFNAPGAGFDTCFYCELVVVDVSGNESCNPPATHCTLSATAGACSTNCGTPIVHAISTCVNVDP